MNPLIDVLAARVHDAYVREKQAQGVTTLPSRHGTGDLMRPYQHLHPADQADDIRAVLAVLRALARMPLPHVWDLIRSTQAEQLMAAVADAAAVCDPPPAGLTDRCTRRIAEEVNQ
jgi:hypothetical protein